MIAASLSQPSLAAALWPARGAKAVARGAALAVFGSLLLWLSAKAQVPFWPVPMTMQTFVVLIIGASYGWRLGGVTVLAYLAEGAVGLPVFAGGGGVAYMGGPTGGFLLGFVLAAMVAGALMSWGRSTVKTIGAMLLAEIALFVPGLLWLGNFLGAAREVGFMAGMDAAIAAGLTPFLLAEALKIALAAAALPIAWKAAARRA